MKLGLEGNLKFSDSKQMQNIPINLCESIESFYNNKFMKNLLGDDLHQHFFAFYNLEYTEFMNQVDEWELNRYLYNI